MFRSFALIFIMVIYCSVQPCRVDAVTVTWLNSTGTFSIPENTPKDSLTLFAATGATNFTILTQNATGQFAIGSKGTLSSTTELDFESGKTLFSLKIMAFASVTENATLSCLIQVTDVNDEKPQFPKAPYSVHIPNNVAIGDSLLNVTATDKDVTDTFNKVEYSIKAGGDKEDFTIDPNTGNIKAANNLTGPHTFKLTVVATDNNNSTFTDEASVTMCINGCSPSGSSALGKSTFAFLAALVFSAVLM